MPLDELRDVRVAKRKKLRDAGVDPYPARSSRTHRIADALAGFDALMRDKTEIVLAGRLTALREHGGSVFADMNDGSGVIQVYLKKDLLGAEPYQLFLDAVDIGDFLESSGALFVTKKNEKTLEAHDFSVLTKSLLPLPEKWHGLQDVEERFRKRHLDLIFNDKVKEKFLARFRVLDLLRKFFRDNDYLEVETPILQPLPGGATARPFKTHMNDLNVDLYLRVAPELYLKRLLVGGFERVFEIGKNFRNEGMDKEHNPEFTMLEAYAAYQDYEWLMGLTEDLLVLLTRQVCGTDEFTYQGKKVHVRKPFERITFRDIVKKYSGLDWETDSEEAFTRKAQELGVTIEKTMTRAIIADEILKKVARPEITDPVFITDHPLDISPLSKRLEPESKNVARFQLLAGGFELANAFSELNDPLDQRERFQEQEKLWSKGNEEAQRLDEDFIQALEYGMPPAAGIGIGVDRLVALLTDSHTLREVLLFPTMKPR